MAIAVEAFCVVGNLQAIEAADHLSHEDLTTLAPNNTALDDGDLWRCSFMAESDAAAFVQRLDEIGFNTSTGPGSDFVIVNEFDLEVTPYCEWLEVAQYQKGIIAWKTGSNPETVTARAGWSPENGSGLTFGNRHRMNDLEFVRLDGSVEVFRDKETGELVYIGRTETPVEALYETSASLIQRNSISPGQPRLRGKIRAEVEKAVAGLVEVVAHHPDFWRAHYFIGKGRESIGDVENAYTAFNRAFEINPEGENVCRGLASACLATDRIEQALAVSIREATLFPDSEQTLGNLAICYLLNQQVPAARKTIDAAIRLNPSDRVNEHTGRLIRSVETGERACPRTLANAGGKKGKKRPASFWNWLMWWR